MAVVPLLFELSTGDANLFSVDDDHKVAGVHVRCIDGFVLAMQQPRNFGGETPQCFALRINYKPLALDVIYLW